MATAVVYPVDPASLLAAAGLIAPILIGPVLLIQEVAKAAGVDIAAFRLVEAPDGRAAAAKAVKLARVGEVALLMKGDLHTDIFLHPVIATQNGLRTGRHISHVYLMDVPDYPRPMLVTDAAINITPSLAEKAGIVQNAIAPAHVIGIARPRVAVPTISSPSWSPRRC